jgi:hypothetical protein
MKQPSPGTRRSTPPPRPSEEIIVLLAHPVILRNLVDRYEALAALHAEHSTPAARRELDDVTYLLCVATGTGDADAALVAATYGLPGARVKDDSVISG